MSYVVTIQPAPAVTPSVGRFIRGRECSCQEARRACMPTFVFSISGQIGFRMALYHLSTCRKRDCQTLKRQVMRGMRKKLNWLLDETIILGCVHIQPFLFGERRILLKRPGFNSVAIHLAHCPKESCARLRRALLLNVRQAVSPNTATETEARSS